MIYTEPRTQSTYLAEMAAHERWMAKSRADRALFLREMRERDREEKAERETEALRCEFCLGFDCKGKCEHDFDRGFDEAKERRNGHAHRSTSANG